jgi:hypothetical protein
LKFLEEEILTEFILNDLSLIKLLCIKLVWWNEYLVCNLYLFTLLFLFKDHKNLYSFIHSPSACICGFWLP